MDDITRLRHPYDIPWHETKARPPSLKPTPSTPQEISTRRIDLAGTDDLTVQFAARGAA